jgi:hypothetical protein
MYGNETHHLPGRRQGVVTIEPTHGTIKLFLKRKISSADDIILIKDIDQWVVHSCLLQYVNRLYKFEIVKDHLKLNTTEFQQRYQICCV